MKKLDWDSLWEDNKKRKAVKTRRAKMKADERVRAMKFAKALIRHNMNQTAAYIQAFPDETKGMARSTVMGKASRFSKKWYVKETVRQVVSEFYEQMSDPKTGVLGMLYSALNTNVLDLFDKDGKHKTIAQLKEELPLDQQLLLTGLNVATLYEPDGSIRSQQTTVNFMGKYEAIDRLAKILGWMDKEDDGGTIDIAQLIKDAARAAKPVTLDGEYKTLP